MSKNSNTLYLSNLATESVNKYEVKRILYLLFTQYGRVVEVIVKKGTKMRGQAHVIFQDEHEATVAMRELQGFPLLGKPVKIQYSLNVSQVSLSPQARLASDEVK
jgi:U2 small nuclear ribonucleoprotein B''